MEAEVTEVCGGNGFTRRNGETETNGRRLLVSLSAGHAGERASRGMDSGSP